MARNLSNAAASLLPYSTIEAAASGNVDAINAVLKHYERYISNPPVQRTASLSTARTGCWR